MTVTFLDAPGTVSPTETIDFTTTRGVVAISVRYDANRAEERAFRDGVWLYPYLGSSGPAGSAAGTYHLVRTGGWPRDFRVHVDEALDTLWETLYERDLTTLPTQSVQATFSSTYKNFTADGQPWFFHGSAGTLLISAGQGMVLGAQGGAFGGNPYAGLFVGLRAWLMAGYDAAKALAVQVRFSGAVSTLSSADIGAFHYSDPGDTWGYGPGNNACIARFGGTRMNTWINAGMGTQNVSLPFSPLGSETLASYVLAAVAMPWEPHPTVSGSGTAASLNVTNRRWVWGAIKRPDTGSTFPPMESMAPTGVWSTPDGIMHHPEYRVGAYLGSTPSTNNSVAARLTHIRVLQKAV